MKGRLNEMKKNTKIAVITFACVMVVGVGITLLIPKTPKNSEMLVSQKQIPNRQKRSRSKSIHIPKCRKYMRR